MIHIISNEINEIDSIINEIQNESYIHDEVLSIREQVNQIKENIKQTKCKLYDWVIEHGLNKLQASKFYTEMLQLEEQKKMHTAIVNTLHKTLNGTLHNASKYVTFKKYYYDLVHMWVYVDKQYGHNKYIITKFSKLIGKLKTRQNELKNRQRFYINKHVRSIIEESHRAKRQKRSNQ